MRPSIILYSLKEKEETEVQDELTEIMKYEL